MAHRPTTPRVAPLGVNERSGQTAELLEESIMPDANIFATLVRAPGLFRKWLPFGGKLLNGKIPARDRELLILRTGWNCRAEYEWGQHRVIAREAGLTEAEITRTVSPKLEGWEPFDATLLRTADELHQESCISDGTWAELAAKYDVQQLIEVPMLVGHYHLVAMTLNSLVVQLDDGVDGFP
ncbi:MAG: carboxymuconolactone decarboxylase family protein [Acidimicrobiales bacterium]